MRRWSWLLIPPLLAYLLSGLTRVPPDERAAIFRFGRLVAIAEPGLHVGLPWGLDRVERVAVERIRRLPFGVEAPVRDRSAMPDDSWLTGDHNLVDVQLLLEYSVNPDDLPTYVLHRQVLEPTLGRVAECVLTEWLASQSIDAILLHGKAAAPEQLLPRLRAALDPLPLGITLHGVNLARLAPPEEVREAFAAVNRAQAEIGTRVENAGREADQAIRLSRARAQDGMESAVGEAHARVAAARTEARAFRERVHALGSSGPAREAWMTALWWRDMGDLLARMQSAGRVNLLDRRLGTDGLDLWLTPSTPTAPSAQPAPPPAATPAPR